MGGWGTGATLIFSGLVALGLLVYSFVKLRDVPRDQVVEVATGSRNA